MGKSRLLLASLLSVGLFSGCSRSGDAVLSIQLPPASLTSSKVVNESVSVSSTSGDEGVPWNGETITQFSEINCYVVMVGGPEAEMSRHQCWDGGQNTLFTFGVMKGGVPAGTKIELSVPPGQNRQIYLLAAKADSGYCTNFENDGLERGKVSFPRFVASTSVNLNPGDNVVNLSVPSDFSSRPEIQNCQVDDEDDSRDPKDRDFGDGRDGDLTISSNAVTTNAVSYNDSTFFTDHNNSDSDVPSSKIFSASGRVTHVDLTNGRILTLSSSFTADEFAADDEIMWHVSQGSHSSQIPDDNACGTGSGLYRGRFGFARILRTTGNTLSLNRPLVSTYSKISNDNLTTGNYASGTNHCRIQVVRVPSFKTLTVPSVNAILRPPAYSPSSGFGGILVFRAQKIDIASGGSLALNASGTGYQGSSGSSGDGAEGPASSSSSSANGAGGGFATKGGGGANAGAGGQSVSSYAMGGDPLTYCLDHDSDGFQDACLPMKDQKAFFGGSGGDGGTYGQGGGLVMLYAYEVKGADSSAKLQLYATGADASSYGGGGAGGSIHFSSAKVLLAPTNLTLEAQGGSATYGGGGGGGVTEVRTCDDPANLQITSDVSGGSSATGGTGGGTGLSDMHPWASYCAL